MDQAQNAHTRAGLARREFYEDGEEGRTGQREKLGCHAVKGSADATWGLGAGRPQAGGWGGAYITSCRPLWDTDTREGTWPW